MASPAFDSAKLFSVKWPRSDTHDTRSVSGVLVETNVQQQVALHFYNEVRELEDEVGYDEQGGRTNSPRNIVYVRELSDSILISDNAALQLRDVLNTLFPPTSQEEPN